MIRHRFITSLLPLAVATAIGAEFTVHAAETDPQDAAITKMAEAFVAAFQKGDAKALSEFWTPDGDYVDANGRVLKGRQAIEQSFAEVFANNKGLKLRIEVAHREFPTPDTAIEDGNSMVIAPEGSAPSRARYTNFMVQKDGKWLLESVREAAYVAPSNYEYLRGLEWVIGGWTSAPANGVVGRVSFEWASDQNFIVATRTIEHKDATLQSGTEWIGWDAAAKQIRSWNFEADGGFGQGTWSKEDGKWILKTDSTLVDGSKVTATNVVTKVDPNTITWQSKDQTVNGKPVPDTKPVTMKRAN